MKNDGFSVLDDVTGAAAIENAPLVYSSGQVVAVTRLRQELADLKVAYGKLFSENVKNLGEIDEFVAGKP